MPILRLLRHILIAVIASAALYTGVRVAQLRYANEVSVKMVSEEARVEASLLDLALLDGNNTYSSLGDLMQLSSPRYTLVNLWATWCTPCRDELPLFEQAHLRFASQGVLVVGIADDDFDKARGFVDSLGLSFPQLINDGSILNLPDYFGSVSAVPLTVLLDEDGVLIQHKFGAFHGDELAQFVEHYTNPSH